MSNRNWGHISSGATFESLATTLVFFEDAGATLFGRRGKDGGQDARSGDKKRVFQAKHNQDGAAFKAIAAAKKEAKKIAKYRLPGHPREPQWRGVTHWRLVTNAAFNPTDKARWDAEVVPQFQELNLVADYWEQANLNALLDKYPEVDRAYFQNQTRVFLSLPEVNEFLPQEEPFLRRNTLGTFVGRDAEIKHAQEFLNAEHSFLVVYGPGGIGKTRTVLEAGERAADGDWVVRWANVASMEASESWFEGIVPERRTLLIVDEPKDERVLQVLSEQMRSRTGRISQWKVAITVRSPNDPVLKFLSDPRMKHQVDRFCMKPLRQEDAEKMCTKLIDAGSLAGASQDWRESTVKKLAICFDGYPVWLTLAVHLLETAGELTKVPETAEILAERYLSEVTKQQSDYSPKTLLALLRWVALVGTLNREDDTAIELVAERSAIETNTAARVALADLVRRRALAERGARNRFVEVKPDVLRDHLLLKWLSADIGHGRDPIQPSDAAEALAAELLQAALDRGFSAVERPILESLARTEFVLGLSGHKVPLLGPFMKGLLAGIRTAAASTRMTLASTRMTLVESFIAIAAYRPEDTVALSQVLRRSSCPTEKVGGVFGSLELGPDDVLFELAWLVFQAASGAQTHDQRRSVLFELCELAKAEFAASVRRPQGLFDGGRRAKDLIGRILEGGAHFWSGFEDAASEVADRLLEEAASEAPNPARREVLEALVGSAASIVRERNWSEGYMARSEISMFPPAHPARKTRSALKAKLKELLERDGIQRGTRLLLWSLFAGAHQSANQCVGMGPDRTQTMLRQELLDDLTWATPVLKPRASDLVEVSAARDLWDWHARFEKNPALRAAAKVLERFYTGNEVAAEFEWLLSRDDVEAREPRSAEKACELAKAGKDAIDAFLRHAKDFFQSDRELHQVSGVAWRLGLIADTSEGVRGFVLAALGDGQYPSWTEFAAIAGTEWVAARRRENAKSAYELVIKLVDSCSSDEQRVHLLTRLYKRVPLHKEIGAISAEEFQFVRSQRELFLRVGRAPSYLACVGWGLGFEWQTLKGIVEEVFDEVPDQIAEALDSLVSAVFWTLRDEEAESAPEDLRNWLLNQLLRTPDLDSLARKHEWDIQEILKRIGKAPIGWLPGALARRRELETQRGFKDFRALSHRMRLLSSFVTPITREGEVCQADAEAICRLLDFASDAGSISLYLHEILREVDPHGRVVPQEVARRISRTESADEAWRLARIGGGFSLDTPVWRTIARPVLARAAKVKRDERMFLYSALTDHEGRLSFGIPGEVPESFFQDVESARQRLEAETEEVFVPFWKWRLKVTEAELSDEKELFSSLLTSFGRSERVARRMSRTLQARLQDAKSKLLDGLETKAADDLVPFGHSRVKFVNVRLMGVQAYMTTK